MSYSATAVRFFTAPKPMGDTMDSPKQPTLEPKITSSSNQVFSNGDAPTQDKANGPVGAPDASSKEKKGLTFANQDSLPKLPIPDLEATCRRYQEALSALQTPREQEEPGWLCRTFSRQMVLRCKRSSRTMLPLRRVSLSSSVCFSFFFCDMVFGVFD